MRVGEARRVEEMLLALALDCPVLAEPVCGPVGRSVSEPPEEAEEDLVAVAVLSNN